MTNVNTLEKLLVYREVDSLTNMIKAYANNPNSAGLGEGVTLEYNPNSDTLFLVDEENNVALMNGDKLEPLYSCFNCGHEGVAEEYGEEREEEGTLYMACEACFEEGRNPEDYLIIKR